MWSVCKAFLNSDKIIMFQAYKESSAETTKVKAWTISEHSGWHCSWCFVPEGILKKMEDAPMSDYPRWGDRPDVANIPNIRKLIGQGSYFDGQPINRHRKVGSLERQGYLSAPQYIFDNGDRFAYLLRNMYQNDT